MNRNRKSLTEVLGTTDRDDIARQFDQAQAAAELVTLPRGTYRCRLVDGQLVESKTKTPGYQLAFAVVDGEHANRRVWHTCWLTPAALPMSKRDLAKIGITSLDMLELPLLQGLICEVKVIVRADDDGTERNRVQSFTVVDRIADPTADPDFGSPVPSPAPVTPPDAAPAANPAPARANGRFVSGQRVLPCVEPPAGGAT